MKTKIFDMKLTFKTCQYFCVIIIFTFNLFLYNVVLSLFFFLRFVFRNYHI